MTTFVLVHGGWHGAWCWEQVNSRLREAGHAVYTPRWPAWASGRISWTQASAWTHTCRMWWTFWIEKPCATWTWWAIATVGW